MDTANLPKIRVREVKTEEVRAFAESMRQPLVAAIQAGGDTDRKVASMLNKQKYRTRTGDRWTFGGVKYLRMLLGIPRQKSKTAEKEEVGRPGSRPLQINR
jgi:hypothetical protein